MWTYHVEALTGPAPEGALSQFAICKDGMRMYVYHDIDLARRVCERNNRRSR